MGLHKTLDFECKCRRWKQLNSSEPYWYMVNESAAEATACASKYKVLFLCLLEDNTSTELLIGKRECIAVPRVDVSGGGRTSTDNTAWR